MVGVTEEGQGISLSRILTNDESAALAKRQEEIRSARRELAAQVSEDRIEQSFGKIFPKKALHALEFSPHVEGEAAKLRQMLFNNAEEHELGDCYNGLQAAYYLATGCKDGISKFDQTFEFVNSSGSKITMRWSHVVDIAREMVSKKSSGIKLFRKQERPILLDLAFDRLNQAIKYGRVNEIRARVEGPVTAENARNRLFPIFQIEDEFASEAAGRTSDAVPPDQR